MYAWVQRQKNLRQVSAGLILIEQRIQPDVAHLRKQWLDSDIVGLEHRIKSCRLQGDEAEAQLGPDLDSGGHLQLILFDQRQEEREQIWRRPFDPSKDEPDALLRRDSQWSFLEDKATRLIADVRADEILGIEAFVQRDDDEVLCLVASLQQLNEAQLAAGCGSFDDQVIENGSIQVCRGLIKLFRQICADDKAIDGRCRLRSEEAVHV